MHEYLIHHVRMLKSQPLFDLICFMLDSLTVPTPAVWVKKPLIPMEPIQGLFSYAVVLLMSCTLCSGSMVSGHRRIHGAKTMAKALADIRLVSSCKAILQTTTLVPSDREIKTRLSKTTRIRCHGKVAFLPKLPDKVEHETFQSVQVCSAQLVNH